MLNINDIAKICGIDWELVFRAIQRLGIIPVHTSGKKKYFDEYQQVLIFEHLFYVRKFEYLTFESSMNKKEAPDYDSFRKFKKETYGKRI